jgi:hypothetical protein
MKEKRFMRTKRLVPTSYGMALAALSALSLPVWVAFAGFGCFVPMFAVQLFASLPLLMPLLGLSLVTVHSSLTVYVFFIGFTLLFDGLVYWIGGRLVYRWLLRHYPWFRSVSGS